MKRAASADLPAELLALSCSSATIRSASILLEDGRPDEFAAANAA